MNAFHVPLVPAAAHAAGGRLDRNVVPVAYTIAVRPDAKAMTFSGTETVTIDVTELIEPGSYAMICPIPGHYQQGQLAEFEIE